MSLALLFPGQGSQHVGMGRDLAASSPDAARLFEEADDILGVSLSRLMWEGPEEALTETRNAQPAILLHSVAVYRALQPELGDVVCAAGHSLGEFSAHVAAGTLALRDALSAVRLRGELMFAAGRERPGTMAAVLGMAEADIERVCAAVSAGVCVPANFNSEGQVVISGDRAGVSEGMRLAGETGARKVMELKVSGAFHSPLMEPAAEGLAGRLAGIQFADPRFPVLSNVTAAPVRQGDEARVLLVRQLTAPVRWAACVSAMVALGATRFLELGPGSVLCGLNKRNARGLPCASVAQASDFAALR